MRIFQRTFATLLLAAAGFSLTLSAVADQETYPIYPTIDYSKVKNPDLIKKGEYLAKTGDCIACHTNAAKGGKPFAGGLGIETPFGAFFSPNITADDATGIGQWTDQQFIDAVREGNGSHGNEFPVMPFLYYNKMSDADVLAIKAYLFAVPQVHAEQVENQVPWPFNVRLAQYSWKILFFYPYRGELKDDPSQSKDWNRGRYLVEGPGHCGMCHSPLNMLGAEKRTYRYTGGFVGGYYAPDITSVGLKNYSVDQIVSVLKDGSTLSGKGKVAGPMLEAQRDSFQYLTDDDARSIAVYLKTVVSKMPEKSDGAVTADTGPKIYNKYCAGCHAVGANGAPVFGDKAAWQSRMKPGLDVVVGHAIDGLNSMPPMGNCVTCSKEQIRAVVQYMVDSSLNSTSSAGDNNRDYFKGLPKITPKQGQAVYHQQCAVCHDKGSKYAGAPKLGDVNAWLPIFQQEGFDDILTTVIKGQSNRGEQPHPLNGGCAKCSTAEIIAATKYLAQQGADGKYDFSLW